MSFAEHKLWKSADPLFRGAPGCEICSTFSYPCILHAVCCQTVSTCCLLQCCLTGLSFWSTPGWPWKFIKFEGCLQGTKSHQNWAQVHKKTTQIDRNIIKNPTSAKSCFLQYLLYENLALRAPSAWISTQKSVSKGTWKRTRKQHQISSPRCPKSFQNGIPKPCQRQ